MPVLYCEKHNCRKEPAGGRPEHRYNWYCTECELEEAVKERTADLKEAVENLTKFRREIA